MVWGAFQSWLLSKSLAGQRSSYQNLVVCRTFLTTSRLPEVLFFGRSAREPGDTAEPGAVTLSNKAFQRHLVGAVSCMEGVSLTNLFSSQVDSQGIPTSKRTSVRQFELQKYNPTHKYQQRSDVQALQLTPGGALPTALATNLDDFGDATLGAAVVSRPGSGSANLRESS